MEEDLMKLNEEILQLIIKYKKTVIPMFIMERLVTCGLMSALIVCPDDDAFMDFANACIHTALETRDRHQKGEPYEL